MAVKKDPRLYEPLQGDGPGAYLRKAREEAEMSIEKVATALLLNSGTVEALEADAYERLPAPTFVRGYLRGYARVLGLPSQPILDMYDRQGFEPPPLSTDATEPTQAHTSDTVVRLVSYGVVVVLVVLVGLWWHSQEDGGFGIAVDLFDRSVGTGEDPSIQATGDSGTAPAGGDADADSVAMVSGSTDERPPDEVFSVPSPAGDAESGDLASGEAPPEGVGLDGAGTEGDSGAEPAQQPGAPTGDEGAAVTGAVGEVTPGEIVEVAPISAGPGSESESIAAAPLQPGTSPVDEEPVATSPAEEAASGDTTEAESARSAASVPAAAADREASASREPRSETVAGVVPGLETSPDGGDGEDAAGESASAPPPARPAPETAGAAPGSGAEPAGTHSGLVLEFVHESWVEVYDGERTRLFFGLVQPGRMLSFDGPQPFDILLGYGKDVRVAIDGQAFDHTPFLRHGVARFSIGAGSDDGEDHGLPNR